MSSASKTARAMTCCLSSNGCGRLLAGGADKDLLITAKGRSITPEARHSAVASAHLPVVDGEVFGAFRQSP